METVRQGPIQGITGLDWESERERGGNRDPIAAQADWTHSNCLWVSVMVCIRYSSDCSAEEMAGTKSYMIERGGRVKN